MVDFFMISTRSTKRGVIEIYPKFIIKKSSDLMIRGGDFYAIWIEERGLWSTDEQDVQYIVDRELDRYAEEYRHTFDGNVKVLHMWDAETGIIDAWHKYCQRQMRDSFHMLDERLIFSNMETTKKDYASKKLPYPLEAGDLSAYEELMSVIYDKGERHKIEWAIGSIVAGDSKKLQKFMVLYGSAGTGKSTILNIIQQLFEGYYSVFDAKALGSSSNQFALEAFKTNPLVAIQHDGDLSKIEDNTRLNSVVSHELMTVNEKFKSSYANNFKCFLFMGTNKPVKITDAKSGLIRRLIDVSPSGRKLDPADYKRVVKQIDFELGAIAQHCVDVYFSNPGAYDDYIPINMMGASNDFYNFVIDSYHVFKKEDGTTLRAAWEMYKTYCEDAKVSFPFSQRIFKEELKNYFRDYTDRFNFEDGSRVRSYYSGFKTEKFEDNVVSMNSEEPAPSGIIFAKQRSVFDVECADCIAQYATAVEAPAQRWDDVRTTLSCLDTSQLHYVRVPENHIVIDFDIPGESGKKCFERNLEAASKWPPTYAELSKSGAGIHLHYIYTGDPTLLSRVYDDHIEVKVFTGKSSLRRKLSKCNNLPIATISSGLPLKGEDKLVNFETIKSERGLRTLIKRNLNKEIHPGTKPSIDFITKILDDAYESGLRYDVSDMRGAIFAFAVNSTNHSDYCMKQVTKMHFKSEEPSDATDNLKDTPLIFYDVEVFPNLFLVNWKVQGKGKPVVRMINPSPSEIEELIQHPLIGFNCRRYDNHILYARLMGYTNLQLYNLSQKIVGAKKNGARDCFFNEAYNISYTDIYDFASAGNKKSLKKLEIEMGIHHQELGLPWDEPVPEEMWSKVAEYCDNDVIATEAAFEYLSADWTARQILADLAGGSVNDSTNSLTKKIIFGNDRNPQTKFNYRNLAEPVFDMDDETYSFLEDACPEMMAQTHGKAGSLMPYFEGYEFKNGKSTYRGEEVSEGGYVYAEPGMYTNVALLDVRSMHPHSGIAEVIFGVEFTKRFKDIVDGRVNIKHEDWEAINNMLDGKLAPYVEKVRNGEMSSESLADALKTAINAVYGQTFAGYENAFKDPRNVDNIIAKRGALFMVDLKHAVRAKGFTVAHIKTDSIKIPNATPEIIKFVMDFGARYGYYFEHEATYDRMCLVNDSTYIAKYASVERCEAMYGYIPSKQKKKAGKWTATAAQFAVPYVFKTLFSKEDICFEDMCETKEVKTALYLDMNEGLPDVTLYESIKSLRDQIARGKSDKLTRKEANLISEWSPLSDEDLDIRIGEGHNYRFIGRVGNFCPIKDGCGGGELLRENKSAAGVKSYSSATGAKGYRWLESEMVRELNKENDIDRSYYDKLVDDAVEAISKYGDFEWFVSDDPVDIPEEPKPWVPPCGDCKYLTCFDCPHFNNHTFDVDCGLGYDISDFIITNTKKN